MEHHLRRAAQGPAPLPAAVVDGQVPEVHLLARGSDEPQGRAADGGLARARPAGDGVDAALADGGVDVVRDGLGLPDACAGADEAAQRVAGGLAARSTIEIAGPGAITSQGEETANCLASASIPPQVGFGGGTPRPRKASEPADISAVAVSEVPSTVRGPCSSTRRGAAASGGRGRRA